MSKIDLHVHSMYSDGTNSPKELVDMAVSIGLRAMALTDHDTIDGVPHAIEAARDYDITIIPGVEISTFYQEGEIHIIGLFVDYNNKEFVAELDQMRIERDATTSSSSIGFMVLILITISSWTFIRVMP